MFIAVLWASLVSAQETFDVGRDLEQYDERCFSEQGWLYDVGPFERRNGQEVTPEQIAELQAQWADECQRVKTLWEVIARDAIQFSVETLEHRLEQSPTLKTMAFERAEVGDGCVLFIQMPARPPAGYKAQMIAMYGPPMRALSEAFDETYAQPCGLTPEREHTALGLVVLSSYGDYINYWGSGQPGRTTPGAHYHSDLHLAVTYHSAELEARLTRRAVLHVLTYALLGAFDRGPGFPPRHHWVAEGLARSLASHRVADDGSIRVGAPDDDAVRLLASAWEKEPSRTAFFVPLSDVFTAQGLRDVRNRALERVAGEVGLAKDWRDDILPNSQRQCGLLWTYLRRELPEEAILSLVENLCVGVQTQFPDALPRDAASLHDLTVSFLAFMRQEMARVGVGERLSDSAWSALAKGDVVASLGAVSSEVDEPRLADAGPFDASQLLEAPPTGATLAAVLELAAAGAFEQAIAQCEGLLDPSTDAKRMEREAERLRSLQGWRRDFLVAQAGTNQRLRFRVDGEIVQRAVKAYDNGIVRVEHRKGEESIPESSLTSDGLLRGVDDAEYPGDVWLRAYVAWLAGRRSWDRGLDDGAEARALAEDATQDRTLRSERAAFKALVQLSAAPLPTVESEVDAAVERVSEYLESHGETRVVSSRRNGLRRLVVQALEVRLEALDSVPGLAVPLKRLGEGRYRVRYDFHDVAELDDFPRAGLEGTRYGDFEIEMPENEWSLSVRKGMLVGSGAMHVRHALRWGTPCRIEYVVRKSAPESTDPMMCVDLHFCDNLQGDRLNTFGFWGLEKVVNDRIERQSPEDALESYYGKQLYRIRVEHDGAQVKQFVNDRLVDSMNSHDPVGGALSFVLLGAGTLELDEVTIEAPLSSAGLGRLRQRWLESELRGVGLGTEGGGGGS